MDLTIKITADATGAIRPMDELIDQSKELNNTFTSLSTASKSLAKLSGEWTDARESSQEYYKAQQSVLNILDRQVAAFALVHNEVETATYAQKLYNKEIQTLAMLDNGEVYNETIAGLKKVAEQNAVLVQSYKAADTAAKAFDVTKFNNALEAQAAIVQSVSGDLKALESMQNRLSAKAISLFESNDTANAEKLAIQLKFVNAEIDRVKGANAALKEFGASVALASKQAEQFKADAIKDFEQSIRLAKDQAKEFAQGKFFEMVGDEVNSLKSRMSALKASIEQNIAAGKANAKQTQDMVAEYKALNAELQSAQSRTTSFTVRIANLVKNFVSAQAIVFLVRKAFQLLTQGIKEASLAASKAEETMNLYMTTFQGVSTAAEKAASTLSNEFKVALSTGQEALGIFGDMAIGLGQSDKEALQFADTSARLVMDLISFKNLTGDTTEIMRRFASGLAGNTENFRAMNIIVKDTAIKQRLMEKGLDKLTGSALEAAKMQERLNIAIEQSPNAIGDMAKTLDSTENVNRRLDQSIKTWQERLGKDVNTWLTPMKAAINEIVGDWNRAAKARENYEKGKSNEGVFFNYDAQGSMVTDDDRAKKSNKLINDKLAVFTASVNAKADITPQLQELASYYGVSVRYISEISNLDLSYLNEKIDIIEEIAVKEKLENQVIANRISLMEDANSAAQSFADTLNEIPNVNVSVANPSTNLGTVAKTQVGTDAILNGIDRSTTDAVRSAFGQLSDADWQSFVSPLELALKQALGESMEAEGLKSQMNAVAQFFETVRNEYLQDGKISDDEETTLNSILETYKKIGLEMDNITVAAAARKSLEETIASILKTQADYDLENRVTEQYGYEDDSIIALRIEQEKLLASTQEQYELALSLELTEDETATLTAQKATTEEKINSYYSDRIAKAEKLVQLEKDAAAFAAITEAKKAGMDIVQGYSRDNFSMRVDRDLEGNPYAEAEKYKIAEMGNIGAILDQMEQAGIGWVERSDYQRQATGAMLKNYELMKEITDEQLEAQRDAWFASQGEKVYRQGDVATIMTGFEEGGPIGALVALLAEWASKLEVVNKLSTILTDSIMPSLNGLLEPLLPFIKILGEAISATAGIIAAIYPALQVVGTVLIYVGAALKQVALLLQAFGKTLEYIITFKWHKLGSVWKDFAVDSAGMWKDANDQVSKIWSKDFSEKIDGMSDELKGKLAVYNDLYSKGILSASEAESMIQKDVYGKRVDTVKPTSASASSYISHNTTTSGTTTVNYGGVVIRIDGVSDPEACAQAVIRILENNGRKDGSLQAYA